jgi:hypothetical protein
MKIVRTLLGFGLVAASVVILRGRRRAIRGGRPADVSLDDTLRETSEEVIELPDRLPRHA